MGYIDAQGRPEIVVNPDLVRGTASWRLVDQNDDQEVGADTDSPTTYGDVPAAGARRALRVGADGGEKQAPGELVGPGPAYPQLKPVGECRTCGPAGRAAHRPRSRRQPQG